MSYYATFSALNNKSVHMMCLVKIFDILILNFEVNFRAEEVFLNRHQGVKLHKKLNLNLSNHFKCSVSFFNIEQRKCCSSIFAHFPRLSLCV